MAILETSHLSLSHESFLSSLKSSHFAQTTRVKSSHIAQMTQVKSSLTTTRIFPLLHCQSLLHYVALSCYFVNARET